MTRAKPHNWTKEQHEYIKENIKGTPYNDMRKMFNEKFGLNMKSSQFNGFLTRNGYRNGNKTMFEKGYKPWNADMEGLNLGGEAGWFQKGDKPSATRPVGAERVCSNEGYTWVKVSEGNRWERKHIICWEEHNGPVPDNHVVCFLDGDKSNSDIDNLELLSRGELAQMNRYRLFTADPELTKAGISLMRLRMRVTDIETKGSDPEAFSAAQKEAEKKGISHNTFFARMLRGWSLHDAINRPLHYRGSKQ